MDDFNKDFFENKGREPSLIRKYKKFLSGKEQYFFDVFEFVEIISFYIEELNFKEANNAIETALSIYPNESEFIFLKATLLFRNSKSNQALELLNQIEAYQFDNPEYHFLKANILSSQNKIDKAIKEYNKVIDIADPDDKIMYLHLIGNSLSIVKRYNEALIFFNKIPKTSLDPEILEDIASTYESLGRYDMAIKYYKESLKKDIMSDFTWQNLAEAYENINEDEKALEAYLYAFAIDDTISETKERIADLFYKKEDYEKALLFYLDLKAKNQKLSIYDIYIANCFLKLKNLDEAEKYYNQALENGEISSDMFHGLAVIEFEKKEYEEALRYIDAALEIEEKENPVYINFKAHTLLMLKQYSDALEYFAKAVALSDIEKKFLYDFVKFIVNDVSDFFKEFSRITSTKVEENYVEFILTMITSYLFTLNKPFDKNKIKEQIIEILKEFK